MRNRAGGLLYVCVCAPVFRGGSAGRIKRARDKSRAAAKSTCSEGFRGVGGKSETVDNGDRWICTCGVKVPKQSGLLKGASEGGYGNVGREIRDIRNDSWIVSLLTFSGIEKNFFY